MTTPSQTPARTNRKPPGLAGLLSLLFPGLGQIFCGQDNKGIFLMGIFLLGHWLTGGFSSFLLCPLSAVDAMLVARQMNQKGRVQRWEFFAGLCPPDSVATKAIPLVLIALVAVMAVVRLLLFAYGNAPAQ